MYSPPPPKPLLFSTPEELMTKVEEYFDTCVKKKKPYTLSGLALALGTNRWTLYNYGTGDDQPSVSPENKAKYADIIKWAKARCENYAEEQLFNIARKNVTGIIFNLKNNYTWVDKREMDIPGLVVNTINYQDKEQDADNNNSV